MSVRAVFLDFGGTLAHRDPEVWDVFIDVCRRSGFTVTKADVSRGRVLADRTHRSEMFPTRELMEEFWTGWFRLILENLAIPGADELARRIYAEVKRRSKLQLYPDVPDALEALRGEVRTLGVVSNYNCMLESYCNDLGIAGFFDFILASDLVRSHKPDSGIFKLAVSEAGYSASECLHVGDSPWADFEGARRAGLRAILIDRVGLPHSSGSIDDLRRLVDILKKA